MSLSISANNTTFVALAEAILPPDLQVYASAGGLCHVQVTGYTVAEQHLIQVTALPYRLHDAAYAERVFPLWIAADHLAHLVPWDRELEGLPTCEVRERLETDSTPRLMTVDRVHSEAAHDAPSEPSHEGQPLIEQEQMTLVPLPEVFISCETVQEAVREAPEPPFGRSPARLLTWTRLVWLQAALLMVRRQMRQLSQRLRKLDALLTNVCAAQRRLRGSLVSASEVYVGKRLVGWRLQIAYPLQEVCCA